MIWQVGLTGVLGCCWRLRGLGNRRLGTLEGARFMVLSLLGVTQAYGLAFGLVARVEQLLWSGMGFFAYGIYPRYVRPVTAPRPVEAIPLPEDLSHTKGTGFPNAYGESL